MWSPHTGASSRCKSKTLEVEKEEKVMGKEKAKGKEMAMGLEKVEKVWVEGEGPEGSSLCRPT